MEPRRYLTSPIPSIDFDDLVPLPAVDANIIAIVLLQHNVDANTVKQALLSMLAQQWQMQHRTVAKSKTLKLPKGTNVFDFYDSEVSGAINKSVRYQVSSRDPETILEEHPLIVRGDVVHLRDMEDYRNSGCFMWNGGKTVKLYTELDDYGSVPPSFTLNQFPYPDYFNNSVSHNRIRWLEFTRDDVHDFIPEVSFKVHQRATSKGYWYLLSLKGTGYESVGQLLEDYPEGVIPVEEGAEYDGAHYPVFPLLGFGPVKG